MEVKKIVSLPSLPPGKPTSVGEETPKRRKTHQDGLIGLVNVGNSCYMNASLQALSNCPPFRQYLIDCIHAPSSTHPSSRPASVSLATLFRKLWTSDRNPGHLNPRTVSLSMKNKLFRSSQQQDAQEFLRSLLNQIHDELSITVPTYFLEEQQQQEKTGHHLQASRPLLASRCSVNSQESRSSCSSSGSLSKLMDKQQLLNSATQTGTTFSSSPTSRPKRSFSFPVSPALKPKAVSTAAKGLYSQLSGSRIKDKASAQHVEIPLGHFAADSEATERDNDVKEEVEEEELVEEEEITEPSFQWNEREVYEADIITRTVKVHRIDTPQLEETHTRQGSNVIEEKTNQCSSGDTDAVVATRSGKSDVPSPVAQANCVRNCHSIITEVFEGELESKVKCSSCMKVSVTRELFQDLSLPIPGRKEMSKMRKGIEEEAVNEVTPLKEQQQVQQSWGSKVCGMMKMLVGLTRELISGPATTLNDCLEAFFDTNELTGDNKYYCKHCKSFQDSTKKTSVTRLPEVLCIHLKRFRFDVYFASKISRYISFPLSGLDMTPYMKKMKRLPSNASSQYELISVITHIGGAGGGHYVAYAKNSQGNTWHEFNDTHVTPISSSTVQDTEGYVLFYRRVSPVPVKPLILSEIVPRPGTTPDSPDACYISRHWLSLRNLMLNPGPIAQYDFACQHGAVPPGKEDTSTCSLAYSIRTEVWNDLVKRFGGGPRVQSLETCAVCESHLKSLSKRRKEETQFIQKMQAEHKSDPKPFYLSNVWLKRWQDFLHCETLEVEPPGPIDNTTLLHRDSNGHVYFNTKCHHHMVLPEVWEYFHQHYGGGPTVVTKLQYISTNLLPAPAEQS